MTEPVSLVERIEAAAGPSRDLDREITILTWREAGATVRDDFEFSVIPEYTASLDAAMTLVPEGHTFAVGQGDSDTDGPWAWCQTPDAFAVSVNPDDCRKAATPALALCAASLRAKEASDAD